MFCPYCGTQMPDGSAICKGCGSPLPQIGGQPAPDSSPVYDPDASRKQNQTANKNARTTAILGVISIVVSYFWFLGLPAGAAAIGLGIHTRKQGYLGNDANIGIVCGVIGIVLSLVVGLLLKANITFNTQ